MTAVYSSPTALAASDAYYAKPVAWAENSGMFAGMDSAFDPAAPCLRADLVTYLHWAAEQWAVPEEDKTIQAEYEQIINDAQLYEVHGSGLLYADYVDVDGDGKIELLTLDSGENLIEEEDSLLHGYRYYEVTATVYANIDGHAGKVCEYTFEPMGSYGYLMYICTYDGHICFRAEGGMRMYGFHDEYYTVENDNIVYSECADCIDAQPVIEYKGTTGNITEAEYRAINEKYTNQKELFFNDFSSGATGISVHDRGILPSAVEHWETNRDIIYAAVLEGDFSYFAGYYEGIGSYDNNSSLTLDRNGVLTLDNGWYSSQPPVSVTITETGSIHCVIEPKWIEYYYDGEIE